MKYISVHDIHGLFIMTRHSGTSETTVVRFVDSSHLRHRAKFAILLAFVGCTLSACTNQSVVPPSQVASASTAQPASTPRPTAAPSSTVQESAASKTEVSAGPAHVDEDKPTTDTPAASKPPEQGTKDDSPAVAEPPTGKKPPDRPLPNPLEELLQRGSWGFSHASDAPARKIDEQKAAAEGIRKVKGKHLTMFTDLPESEEVDGLPKAFDAAYPQWCRYFGLPEERNPPWHVQGFVISDREKFQRAGLIREEVQKFLNGTAFGHEIWLMDQPTGYYRRHLLLHEGTHSFMYCTFIGDASPWYIEGVAELLGTHRLSDGQLTLGHFPQNREEVPFLGRIKLLREAFAKKQALLFPDILKMPYRSENENYAFWWAAAAFLDGHPRYRERFHKLHLLMKERKEFPEKFRAAYADDWSDLCEEWQVFLSDLDYGYDIARGAIQFQPGQPLLENGKSVSVAADKSWQSTGIKLDKGVRYRITASGRYQVRKEPKIWWCEPQGVSIEYYQGLPLGTLMGALRPDRVDPTQPSQFLRPAVVGRELLNEAVVSGTLYLRINEFPGNLADNEGNVQVKIEKVTEGE